MTVLIVGLGSIAKKHLSALRKLRPDMLVYALRSSSSSLSFDGVKDIYSWEELADLNLDFVIISNPTSEHKWAIERLLDLQMPLFIEKPLYHSLAIEDLVHKVERSGQLTYVACNLRFLDCLKFVKEVLSEKKKCLNEVNVYCGSFLPDWRAGVDYRKIYSAISSMGGGVHLDLIHELDYLYWFFNMPRNIHSIFSSRSTLCIDAYDYANYCLEYDSFCANVVLNYYRKDTKRTLELVFEDETWSVDLLTNKIICGNKVVFSSDQVIGDTYLAQMDYVLQLIEERKTVSQNTICDAFNVLKICLIDDTKR
ncbi:Gfo/Idh/MocA family oxidoreductase [uncultured Parabacteroides sp.]|uniref:Gfo/Idh/MocA family protein n=1 Tax=uncultured Parabacteroides sp. TaxID=512312 RepID=UPI0025DFB714|nr:Gfo/Idh/MocA family oxidoreductase [uncultured Parabacteroides sp.]